MAQEGYARVDSVGIKLCHQILVLDSFLRVPLNFDDRDRISRSFLKDIIDSLGMAPLAPAEIYPATDQRAPGWSFVLPITTSHVSAHYFERPGRLPNIRLDAYSCEPFDWRTVVQVCHRHFSLECWRANLIRRGLDTASNRAVRSMSGRGARVMREERLLPGACDRVPVASSERMRGNCR